jgi:hypothetical protein
MEEILKIDEWLARKEQNPCKLIKGHFIIMENDSFIITNDYALSPEQVKELHASYVLNKADERNIKS